LLDLLFRVAYRCAYALMRLYWIAAHPRAHGALVVIWHGGKLLLVRNSYTRFHSLPGGYVRSSETGRDAAVRELHEEIGLRAEPSSLSLALDVHHEWLGKREHVEIFEIDVPEPPVVKVDNREVVSARFYPPEEALRLELFPPIRTVIEQRMARGAP
jgi:8-oxo-dGTP pyrophosphatase MutT (NUDIX family)